MAASTPEGRQAVVLGHGRRGQGGRLWPRRAGAARVGSSPAGRSTGARGRGAPRAARAPSSTIRRGLEGVSTSAFRVFLFPAPGSSRGRTRSGRRLDVDARLPKMPDRAAARRRAGRLDRTPLALPPGRPVFRDLRAGLAVPRPLTQTILGHLRSPRAAPQAEYRPRGLLRSGQDGLRSGAGRPAWAMASSIQTSSSRNERARSIPDIFRAGASPRSGISRRAVIEASLPRRISRSWPSEAERSWTGNGRARAGRPRGLALGACGRLCRGSREARGPCCREETRNTPSDAAGGKNPAIRSARGPGVIERTGCRPRSSRRGSQMKWVKPSRIGGRLPAPASKSAMIRATAAASLADGVARSGSVLLRRRLGGPGRRRGAGGAGLPHGSRIRIKGAVGPVGTLSIAANPGFACACSRPSPPCWKGR